MLTQSKELIKNEMLAKNKNLVKNGNFDQNLKVVQNEKSKRQKLLGVFVVDIFRNNFKKILKNPNTKILIFYDIF